MQTFGDRINRALEHRDWSQAELARRAGISAKTVERYAGRDEAPDMTRDSVERKVRTVADRLGVRFDWLVKGEGAMRTEESADELISVGEDVATPNGGDGASGEGAILADDTHVLSEEQLRAIGYRRIRDLEVGAGEERDMVLEPVNGGVILPDWYIRSEFGVQPNKLCRLRVYGPSMKETLQPGQRVWAARWEGEPLRDDGIYALHGPLGYTVKRLIFGTQGGEDVIWIWADNDAYADHRKPLTKEEFDQEYRVLAWALEVSCKL